MTTKETAVGKVDRIFNQNNRMPLVLPYSDVETFLAELRMHKRALLDLGHDHLADSLRFWTTWFQDHVEEHLFTEEETKDIAEHRDIQDGIYAE